MKYKFVLPLITSVSIGLISININAATAPNTVRVGNTVWHNQIDIDPEQLINNPIPDNANSLFFIRRYDNDPEQLSANIAINDRFQVSLHPGNYTQVYSCSGINRLSAAPTGLKTNDLLLDEYPYTLDVNQNYYFFIDVDTTGATEIQQITQDSALEVLKNKHYQAHQISRVVPNCPIVVVEPPPAVVTPAQPTPSPVAPPVLEEKVSIELEVLFDNDKSIIKPHYFSEIAEVADFMKEYANTTAVIEGHTDSNASDEYNISLSQRRADAVREMLVVQFGIDPTRITTVGYGESRPRATNATASGRQQNRRVIAVIQERE